MRSEAVSGDAPTVFCCFILSLRASSFFWLSEFSNSQSRFTRGTTKRTFIAERPLKLKSARQADLETVNDGDLDDVLSQISAAMTDEGIRRVAESPGEAGATEIDVLILCAKAPVIGEHVL